MEPYKGHRNVLHSYHPKSESNVGENWKCDRSAWAKKLRPRVQSSSSRNPENTTIKYVIY